AAPPRRRSCVWARGLVGLGMSAVSSWWLCGQPRSSELVSRPSALQPETSNRHDVTAPAPPVPAIQPVPAPPPPAIQAEPVPAPPPPDPTRAKPAAREAPRLHEASGARATAATRANPAAPAAAQARVPPPPGYAV